MTVKKSKIILKEGDAVCHISNMKAIMTIDKIIYESREIICNNNTPKAILKEDGQYYRRKSFLQGIQCKYLDVTSGRLSIIKELFHSNTLIPHSIVIHGESAIQNFLIELSSGNPAFKKEK